MDKEVPPQDFSIPGSRLWSARATEVKQTHTRCGHYAPREKPGNHSGRNRAVTPLAPEATFWRHHAAASLQDLNGAYCITGHAWLHSGLRALVRTFARCSMHLFLPPAQTSFLFMKRGASPSPGSKEMREDGASLGAAKGNGSWSGAWDPSEAHVTV